MRKTILLVLVVVVAGILYAGGQSEGPQAHGQSSVAGNPSVHMRFSWWGGDARHKATLSVINMYEKANPGVTIEAEYQGWDGYEQKVATEIAGGTVADIVQLTSFRMQEFSKKNDVFADLYKDNLVDISGFDKTFLNNFCVVDGKLQGLPTGINSVNIGFNSNYLSLLGLDPQKGYTWDQFFSAGEKVQKDNPKHYFMTGDSDGYHYLMMIYLRQKTGNWLVTDDYKLGFSRSDAIDAFTLLKKLVDEKLLEPVALAYPYKGKTQENPDWINGNIGAIVINASTIDQYTNPKSPITPGNFPQMPDAKATGIVTQPSQLFCVTKGPNREAAEKFLNWLYTDKSAILALGDTRGVPPTVQARKDLAAANKLNPTVADAVSLALAKTDAPVNQLSEDTQIKTILMDTIEAVTFGKLTPTQAADQLIQQLTQKLNEYKNAAS